MGIFPRRQLNHLASNVEAETIGRLQSGQQIPVATANFEDSGVCGDVEAGEGGDGLMVPGVPVMPTIDLRRIMVEKSFPVLQILLQAPRRTVLAHGSNPLSTALLLLHDIRCLDGTHEIHTSVFFRGRSYTCWLRIHVKELSEAVWVA